MKNKKLLGIGLFAALAAVLAVVFFTFREKPVEGSKAITIEVVSSKEESTIYELKTDAMYLKDAMDEAVEYGFTYEGIDDKYGYVVNSVNGEEAVMGADSGAYWSFEVNGAYCNYGISTQPVADGDAFRIVFTNYAKVE